jgi:phage gp29-like protein
MALDIKKMVSAVKGIFGHRAAGFDSDPGFFGKLHNLPNPDPILRAMGVAEKVYASIMADPHVIGDIRSIRGEFRDMDYRVVTWAEDDPKAQAARDLCERWMQNNTPNPAADWEEIMWQMMSSIFTGYTAHELVWGYWDGSVVPLEVLDRPNRRFSFDLDANPLLISKENREGAPVEPYRFIVSRHMARVTNPYGQALLSSCFWAWTFKTGGWKYFVKYCERHGLPWPIARYGQGANEKDLGDLREAIEAMVDSGYAIVPEGTGVELLVPTSSGSNLPQENLINLANREMSKALTGQAMVAENQKTGARAASETAGKRQSLINAADRGIAASSFSRIFRHITTFNFGPDVPSPELEFFKMKEAGKDRADTYQVAADMGAKPSRKAMLEELNIPQATDDADALQPTRNIATPSEFSSGARTQEFTAAEEETIIREAAQAADDAIEANVIEPIARLLAQAEKDGKSLADVRGDLTALLGDIDNDELTALTNNALVWSFTQGYTDDHR